MSTPSQTRLLRALAAANTAYNAYESPKTYHKLRGAEDACANLACIRDGKVFLFETETVCINEGSCSSPRWGEERTGNLVAWHADDSPSRWQPSRPQWDGPEYTWIVDQPSSPGYEPSAPSPASPQRAPDSPRGDEPECTTSPDERAPKRARTHGPCWLD